MESNIERFKKVLSKLNIEVYQSIDNDDLLVCFGRLKPINAQDSNLKAAESRLIFFIEKALKLEASSEKQTPWVLRFSRPWLLKNDKLAFTWDFTIKGDLNSALSQLESIPVAPTPPTNGEAPMNGGFITPARGSVKQVKIGAIRR